MAMLITEPFYDQGTQIPFQSINAYTKTDEPSFTLWGNQIVMRTEEMKKTFINYFQSFSEGGEIQECTEARQESSTIVNRKYKVENLFEQFDKEIGSNYSYFQSIKEERIKTSFKNIVQYIENINYKEISLEFTSEPSFFFNILFENEWKSHIEVYWKIIQNMLSLIYSRIRKA
ncbi:MAG: hypothetical protein PF693_16640 [Spirochaetia bacterium]|nr:hypothetical protein [Spirochaetia bacterium]